MARQIIIIFMSLFIECFAQLNNNLLRLAEHSSSNTKSCSSGYVHGVDRFIYSGYVNTTDVNITAGQTLSFEIQHPGSTIFETVCSIHLANVTCDNEHILSNCYCRSNISSILEIVLNITADIMYSQKIIILNWYLDSVGQKNIYKQMSLPTIYKNSNTTLMANGQKVQLDSCNITVLTDLQITWCVENLTNHTLMISSNNLNNISQNECVTYVITSNVLQTDFVFSYEESQGCHRKESYSCNIYVQEASHQKSCEDECQDVVLTHAILTVVVIVISTISIVSIITEKESPLNILLILLSLVVIAQIILVVIAGTGVEYKGKTTLHIWKILIIYQCAIYFIFIFVQFILLNLRTKLNSCCLVKPWVFLLAMICIHSVFGMIFLPILIKYIVNDKQDKEIELRYVSRIK